MIEEFQTLAEFKVGDLIQHVGWFGMIINPTYTRDTMLIFVIKNDNYKNQEGKVAEWTRHNKWRLVAR